ncbi:MAG: hypothetical protein AB7N71_09115 [Phycisphaerae bacterium]
MNQTQYRLLILLAAILAALAPGCKQPTPATVAPATDIEFDESSATAVARAMLTAMEREVSAIAAKDRNAAASYRALIEEELASLRAVQLVNGNAVHTSEEALKFYRSLTARWEAEIAYYLPDVDYAELREVRHENTPEGEVVSVHVPARNSGDKAVIRLDLAKTAPEQWQVGAVLFVPPSKTTGPSDQPVSITNPPTVTPPQNDAPPEP